jgi:hypothetical protein
MPRAEWVKRYFRLTPDRPDPDATILPLGMLGAIALVLCVGLAVLRSFSPVSVALLTVVLGVAGLFLVGISMVRHGENRYRIAAYENRMEWAEPKPPDEQMRTWLENDVQRIADEGLQRLRLAASDCRDIRRLTAPVFSNRSQGRRGHDGYIRSASWKVLIVYLTEKRLSTYECTLDLGSSRTSHEETKEFHVQDIDAVQTERDSQDVRLVTQNVRVGGILSRSRSLPDSMETELVRVIVSGRTAAGIVLTVSSFARESLENPSRKQIDQEVARLRQHVRTER